MLRAAPLLLPHVVTAPWAAGSTPGAAPVALWTVATLLLRAALLLLLWTVMTLPFGAALPLL